MSRPPAFLQVSGHAQERYIERVKPMIDLGQAATEIKALIEAAELTVDPPAWFDYAERTGTETFSEPCEGICFVLTPVFGSGDTQAVKAVVIRSGYGEDLVEIRRKHKRQRRAAKRTKRNSDHHGARSGRPAGLKWRYEQ